MGLISLPMSNKVSTSNYWENIWDSSLLFKKFFFLTLYLNKFLYTLFFDNVFLIIINNFIKKKYFKGYKEYKKIQKLNNFFLLGKLWIFKYQTWYILVLNIFNVSNTHKRKKINKKVTTYNFQNYIHKYYNIKNMKQLQFLNYKNIF